MPPESLIVRWGQTEMVATRESTTPGTASITLADGNVFQVRETSPATYRVAQGDRSWLAVCAADGERQWVFANGEIFVVEVQTRNDRSRDSSSENGRIRRTASGAHGLTTPMPASVRKIMVAVGQAVKKGETLLVLEAMKMEMPIKSPADGVVKKINCQPNQLIQPDVQLIELE